MIKAEELRIGNYVYDKVSMEWMVVDEISKTRGVTATLVNKDNNVAIGWEMAYIPLTPEIFSKFGFELKEGKYYEKGLFIVYEFGRGVYTLYKYAIPNIQYLHELQNLYFAFHNKELEIKELG